MDLFGSFRLPGELGKHTPNALTFPTGEIKGWEGLSWHWSVPLWRRSDAGNVRLFLCPLQCIQTWFIFSQQRAGTSPLKLWTLIDALPSVSDCPRQCSPGTPRIQPREVPADSTARTNICMLLTWWMNGWLLPWHMVLDHTAPKRHFCPCMGAKLLLLRGRYEQGTSYLAISLSSVLFPLLFSFVIHK